MSRAKQKISIVSLGCARNLVDSEVMAGLLQQSEYVMVQQPADADVIIVNTCGFIDAARELPEVDLFIGTGEVPRVAEILREHETNTSQRQYVGVPSYIYDHATPRLRSTPSYTAFVKVSEGCDHKCAFCIIPQLRGPHRSRSIESVVTETKVLADRGVKEINLIAQDLTSYGRERKDGTTLYGLLKQMTQIPDLEWIRLLYSYPNFLEKPLLDLIRDSDKICKYLDIPFQHVSRSVLQRMRRGKSGSA